MFSSLLRTVFEKFHVWRESSSDKRWALEKLKDVYIKESNLDPDLLRSDDFINFVHGFFEDRGHCIQYPDFVMNEVVKMITDFLIRNPDLKGQDLRLVFRLLRSVISNGQFDKGQRVSTMFDCMHKLLLTGTTLDEMMACKFDAAFALMFATAGAQNYTRKSASAYFIQLVKFASNESEATEGMSLQEARATLREILSTLFSTFNADLMHCSESSTSTTCLNICENYCRILALCAGNSSEWGLVAASSSNAVDCAYNVWTALLRYLIHNSQADIGDVIVSSVEELAGLASKRICSDDRESACEMLTSLLFTDMADADGCVASVSDLMSVACTLVSRCESSIKSPHIRSVLLDVSIFALLMVTDVQLPNRKLEFSNIFDVMKKKIEESSTTKQSSFISCALHNAFTLARTNDKGSSFALTIHYFTFKSIVTPQCISRPLLRNGEVTSKKALTYLLYGFQIFKNILNDPTRELLVQEAESIQFYISPVVNCPGISHKDLTTALEVYVCLLDRMKGSSIHPKVDCVRSVLDRLELHLVNIDSNMREAALKGLVRLYVMDIQPVRVAMVSSKILHSLWGCVKDKDENVVTQVFDFILQIVKSGNKAGLDELLTLMNTTQMDVITELQGFLLSRQWDVVKPVAFSLFSSLSSHDDVIRYAEVCLQQSSCLAAPEVFHYIDGLFRRWTDSVEDDVEDKVDGLCGLLVEGWGDLLLAVVNGENTSFLRRATDILVHVHGFINKTETANCAGKRIDFLMMTDGGCVLADGLTKLKDTMIQYTRHILKGSLLLEPMGDGIDRVVLDNTEKEIMVDEKEVMNVTDDIVVKPSLAQPLENLDSTAEQQPFELSKQLFLLPKLISTVTESLSERSHSNFQLLAWVGFKEVLDQLPLLKLQTEAYRSTDEYDRNSVTILHDIKDLMDSTLRVQSKQMEKEVVVIFLNRLLRSLDSTYTNPLSKLAFQVECYTQSRNSFFQFVSSKRRTLLLGEVDVTHLDFSANFFDNGISVMTKRVEEKISTKVYFPLTHGMEELLDEYLQLSEKGLESVHLDSKSSQLVDGAICGSHIPKQDSGEKVPLEPFQSIESFLKVVAEIKDSKKKDSVCLSILDLLNRTIKTCETVVKNEEESPLVVSFMASLKELKEWFCEDDDDGFDSDNDPTLVDCY